MKSLLFAISFFLLLPLSMQAADVPPIAELYLFPRERLTDHTLASYKEVIADDAWKKFDKVCVYGALPSEPSSYQAFVQNFQELTKLKGRPLAFQAPTIGSGGWEQMPWTRADFWQTYGSQQPSDFLGADVESLKLKPTAPSAERAQKVREYLLDFIRVADARHAQKDVWYTGSWEHFVPSGTAAPLVFTPDLVSQLDRVHWMDLPKLLTMYGGEPALRKQIKQLLDVTGPEKTYVQLGFLNDMDMAANAARASRMLTIAREMGVTRFTIYVKLAQIHDPSFQKFYDELRR